MNIYRPKTIVDGYRIGIPGGQFVAIPKEKVRTDLLIVHGEEEMEVRKGTRPVSEKTFADKFGRDKLYTLWYFPWKPDKKNVQWSMDGRMKLLEAWKKIKRP